jgi:hypothetical protein
MTVIHVRVMTAGIDFVFLSNDKLHMGKLNLYDPH